jgi:hypothetical protein
MRQTFGAMELTSISNFHKVLESAAADKKNFPVDSPALAYSTNMLIQGEKRLTKLFGPAQLGIKQHTSSVNVQNSVKPTQRFGFCIF